jgi:hypothetical protein
MPNRCINGCVVDKKSINSQAPDLGGVAAVLGVGMFLVVVLTLHVVQTHYDPVNQLMSELALGPYGWTMFLAFAGIAIALAGLQFSIAKLGATHALRGLLILAAAFFLAAGVFPLGETSTIHISAIAAAFVTAVLSMYLFPSLAGRAAALAPKSLSWPLAAGVAISVALGHSLLPIGVGQRMAASFLLLWILVSGIRLWRARRVDAA